MPGYRRTAADRVIGVAFEGFERRAADALGIGVPIAEGFPHEGLKLLE